MTAYELFNKVYKHYYGQFLRHLWRSSISISSPQKYIAQAFNELLDECSVEWATGNTRFVLTYDIPQIKI